LLHISQTKLTIVTKLTIWYKLFEQRGSTFWTVSSNINQYTPESWHQFMWLHKICP